MLGHITYILLLVALGLSLPPIIWDSESKSYIFILGILAIWRFGWAGVNWIRFLIFKHIVYPHWRHRADALGEDGMPSHIYLLITSFRIGAETSRRVYGAAIEEAVRSGLPCTIVASIVERCDQLLVKEMFALYEPPEHVKLICVRIAGSGKRDGLAAAFKCISRQSPPSDALVAVIDGDSILEKNLIRRCASFFKLMPDVAALTTDETCEVEGSWIFREWYNMRFAQRNVYMGSHSLSKRVLTLTGRMSMFRAHILCDPQFIERVECDWIDHWRLGRFKFLTGDDKSSWFDILKAGHAMLYIPDVNVVTIETPPHPNFIICSRMLMRRWFGNMLRTNARAIMLGPKPMGWFPWLAIVDQRVSMWTALSGIFISVLATFAYTPLALFYFAFWIMFTRYVMTMMLLASRPRVTAWYPMLMFYNQIMGSWVKANVLFRLDNQKWTRQNTTLKHGRSYLKNLYINVSTFIVRNVAFVTFLVALATFSGAIELPDLAFWSQIMQGYYHE